MKKWNVMATVESSLYVGDVEAENMQEAMELGKDKCEKARRNINTYDLENSDVMGLEEVVEVTE